MVEAWGDRRVDEITEIDLVTLESHLKKLGMGGVTVRRAIDDAYMLIDLCVKKGWIRDDPRHVYDRPVLPKMKPRSLTRGELQNLFDFAAQSPRPGWSSRPHVEWLVAGLVSLGLRSESEIPWCRWENVDWENRFLRIDRSHRGKEASACRPQPIPKIAMPLLEARRRETGWIWTDRCGKQ